MRPEFRPLSFAKRCELFGLLLFIALCLPAAASPAQAVPATARPAALQCPPPGLSVDVIESVLKFRAFEKDRSVSGLRRDDVQVWDEGKLREISSFVPNDSVDRQVVVLVDSSGSMAEILPRLQKALATFADLITEGQKSADLQLQLMEFNDTVRTVVPSTTDPAVFKKKADEIRVGGSTALVDAIMTSIKEGFVATSARPREGEKRPSKYLIVFTDAGENSSRHAWSEISSTMLGEDIAIYGVIFNSNETDGNLKEFQKIASQSGGKLFMKADINDLKNIHAEIAKDIRSFYELTFKVPSEEIVVHRWRNVNISIPSRRGISIVSQTGYCPKIPCQAEDGSFIGGRPINFAGVCSMNNASNEYLKKTLAARLQNVVFDFSRDTEKIIKDLEKEEKPIVVIRDWRLVKDSARAYSFRTLQNEGGADADTCTLELLRSANEAPANDPAEPVSPKGASFRVLRAVTGLRLLNQQPRGVDFLSNLTFLLSDSSRRVSFPIGVYCRRPRYLVDDDLISLAVGSVETALKVKARSSGK